MPKDPVCGQIVKKSSAKVKYKGKEYYFCCATCQWAFEKHPERFAK